MSAENNKTPVTPRDALRRAGAVAFWLLVWKLASMAVGSELLLAGPAAVLVRLAQLVPTAAFWSTVGFSLARIAAGFAAAFVLGLLLGLAAHRWHALAELLAPAVSFLKSVPIVCVIVLLLMWVGSVRVSAIAVFLAVFPAIYFSVLEGRAAASPGLGELLRVMGVPGWRRFLANTWQQLLPYLVATCRNACGRSNSGGHKSAGRNRKARRGNDLVCGWQTMSPSRAQKMRARWPGKVFPAILSFGGQNGSICFDSRSPCAAGSGQNSRPALPGNTPYA